MKWRLNNMKRISALLLGGALCLGLLAGCGGGTTTPSTAPSDTGSTESTTPSDTGSANTELTGTVNTDGSTSMESVILALSEAFNEMYPDVVINYSGTGSGSGIENATNGTVDIGLSSRALSDEETAAGAVSHVVALDGVAIVVNTSNSVSDLTVDQIAQIFTGEITNWSELGGEDQEIAVFGREAGSGTRGAFEEIVGVEDVCKYTNEYSSTGDVIGNVASNPGAIGYASLSAVDDSVKALSVGGVECSEATVLDGSYAIQRPFVMITKEGAELSEATQAFLDYAMSADAASVIELAGAVSPNA